MLTHRPMHPWQVMQTPSKISKFVKSRQKQDKGNASLFDAVDTNRRCIPHHPLPERRSVLDIPRRSVKPSDLAGTSEGSSRRVTAGNCCCYYLGCGRHWLRGRNTEPCPPLVRGSVSHTAVQMSCQRRQAGSRWEGVGDVQVLDRGHQLADASGRSQVPRRRSRGRGPGRKLELAPRQPFAVPLPPSSWPSILFESP